MQIKVRLIRRDLVSHVYIQTVLPSVRRDLDTLTPHTSHLTPHTSHFTFHTSHLTPHTSHLPFHISHFTTHILHFTSHISHLTPHTSHLFSYLTPKSDTDNIQIFSQLWIMKYSYYGNAERDNLVRGLKLDGQKYSNFTTKLIIR